MVLVGMIHVLLSVELGGKGYAVRGSERVAASGWMQLGVLSDVLEVCE
jgi:hypothetical protein